ncbi:hypothetical protein LCGC14_0783610 [marine sediment metagenome]|uniref:Uncharacterized protein n=1 Tax=marine sediment metagenome TaxID=412755 RepID=A0A0F9T1U4_9ZZZZ
MSKYEFFEGQAISTIHLNNEEYISVRQKGVSSIKIVMETGQMARVPWAIVFYDDCRWIKHNLAKVSSVELALKAQCK